MLVEAAAVAIRLLLFGSVISVVGVLVFLVFIGLPATQEADPDTRSRFAALDQRLLRLAGWTLVLAVGAGALDLARQAAVASGLGFLSGLDRATVATVLGETRYGTVWLVRQALLILAGLLLVFRHGDETGADWVAVRSEVLVLAAVSLGLISAAGHAASAAGAPLWSIGLDALHLLASGAWLGALVPLALGLGWTATLAAPAGAGVAAAMTARFSALGLGAVATLGFTGAYAAGAQVASVPAFIGTPYGRWLGVKIALFGLLVGVAALNLRVVKPRLLAAAAASAPTAGPLCQRLRCQVLVEAALGVAVLGVVAVLGISTPARHDRLTWPLSFRLAWEATRTLPGVQTRVAVGSQLAFLGLVTVLLAAIVKPRRRGVAALGGGVAVVLGAAFALPAIAVDAHPTTYLRPSVPYAAASIVEGGHVYQADCAACHGVAGWGDGPAAAGLRPPPANLTAKHTGDHTAGDLYWWVSRGIPGSAMPGFDGRLPPEARWDVINYIRLLAAAESARGLGPVALSRPTIVAPDFAFSTGVGEGRALRDLRGRGPVLLVLFSLPESLDRLTRLNDVYAALRLAGGEIIGIPIRPIPHIYRRLGDRPIFFPVAVDGGEDAAATYLEFRRDLSARGRLPEPPLPDHMELLVDRQGYLRARWMPRDGDGWADPSRLVAEVARLGKEVPVALPPEHVH